MQNNERRLTMRKAMLLMTLLFCASCSSIATPASDSAICDATRAARADLAKALAVSPDDAAVVSGARLIRQVDAGCGV